MIGVPAVVYQVKDTALLQLWCRSTLRLGFSPWPGNFHVLWVWLKKKKNRSSHPGAVETNPTRNHEVAGLIPGLAQCVKDPVLP